MERKGKKKINKESIIFISNAVIHPNTMVIKIFTASITFTAMLSLILDMYLTAFTIIYVALLNIINIIYLTFILLLIRMITWINYATQKSKY